MNDLYVCTFYTFRNSSIVSLVMNFLQYAGIGAGGLVATVAAVDYMFPWLKHDLYYIRKLVSAKRMMDAFESSNSLFIDVFEKRCREIPQKTFLIFKVSVFQQAERLIQHSLFETCTKISIKPVVRLITRI